MEPVIITLFGVTGDLSQQKLLPTLLAMFNRGELGAPFAIIGYGRRAWSQTDFHNFINLSLESASRTETKSRAAFLAHCYYQEGQFDTPDRFLQLAQRIHSLEADWGKPAQHIFYLATAPEFFLPIVKQLAEAGLNKASRGPEPLLVLEKPFGHDSASATLLNQQLHHYFGEIQTYRIDHYLGKQSLRRWLTEQHSNLKWQELLNKDVLDSMQITLAEPGGINLRGPYYDHTGAVRDIFQNHGVELIALTAMDLPMRYEAAAFQQARTTVLKQLKAVDFVLGQYTGYLQEDRVNPSSRTETYVAVKCLVDNSRWDGVPFYFRTGKKLPEKSTQIVFIFKGESPSHLTLRIDPDYNLSVSGHQALASLFAIKLQATLPHVNPVLEPYEQLFIDMFAGNKTYFVSQEEVEAAWHVVDPILAKLPSQPVQPYPHGSWGPEAANKLIEKDGRQWVN